MIDGDPGAELTVSPRPDGSGLVNRAGFNLALFGETVQSGNSNINNSNTRTITWDSDVVVLAGPQPELIVGPDGKVVRASNITVNGIDTPAVGTDLLSVAGYGGNIVVADIYNDDDNGDVVFEAIGGAINESFTNVNDAGGHFWALFTFKQSFEEVRITNESSGDLIINTIDVELPRRQSVARPPQHGRPRQRRAHAVRPRLHRRARPDRHQEPELVRHRPEGHGLGVLLALQFPGAAAIENPIGETRILTTGGDIRTAGSGMIIRTNTLGDPFAAVLAKDFERLSGYVFTGAVIFATNGSAADSITLSGGAGWIALVGLEVGDLVKLTGAGGNSDVYQVADIVGATLTLNTLESVTAGAMTDVTVTPFHGIEATAGNVGTAATRVRVDLVRSTDRDEHLYGEAGVDLALSISGRLRLDPGEVGNDFLANPLAASICSPQRTTPTSSSGPHMSTPRSSRASACASRSRVRGTISPTGSSSGPTTRLARHSSSHPSTTARSPGTPPTR